MEANRFDLTYGGVQDIINDFVSFRPVRRHTICLGEREFRRIGRRRVHTR